jgi:hypothetical protein
MMVLQFKTVDGFTTEVENKFQWRNEGRDTGDPTKDFLTLPHWQTIFCLQAAPQ